MAMASKGPTNPGINILFIMKMDKTHTHTHTQAYSESLENKVAFVARLGFGTKK
jgi:hypothetical protein